MDRGDGRWPRPARRKHSTLIDRACLYSNFSHEGYAIETRDVDYPVEESLTNQ